MDVTHTPGEVGVTYRGRWVSVTHTGGGGCHLQGKVGECHTHTGGGGCHLQGKVGGCHLQGKVGGYVFTTRGKLVCV